MKKTRYIWLPVASTCLMLASCADDYKETIPMPEKPVDVTLSERLSSYDVLTKYASEAGLKIGVAVNPDDLAAQELLYSVVTTNFDQVESASKFTPKSFMNSESVYDFTPLSTLVDAAGKAGVEVFGPALCSDVNIPSDYLKSLIATVVIPYEPWSEDILITDFENEEVGKEYPSAKKAAGSVNVEIADDPLGQQGKVLGGTKLTMDVPMIAQVKLPEGFTLADVSRVMLKCLITDGKPTTSRIQIESAGFSDKRNPYGTQGQWEEYVFNLSDIKFKEEELARNIISIAVGAYGSNVTCYVDDIKIRLDHLRGDDTVIEKTQEEKEEIITTELYKWVDGVTDICGDKVKEYIIFDEPLDSETASFHWSDVIGDKYVVDVQKAVDAKAGAGVKYYVSQSLAISEMMTEDVANLKREIQALESRGVRVDGINIVLDATYNQDYSAQLAVNALTTDAIKSLASLNKPVRISSLRIKVIDENGIQGNPVNFTTEQRQAVGEYYEVIVDAYRKALGDKAVGISFSTALDTNQDTAPWLQNGNRSFVYEGIVKGLTK